jgi:TonB family protein
MLFRYWISAPLFGSLALHAAIAVTFGRGSAVSPSTVVDAVPSSTVPETQAVELEVVLEPVAQVPEPPALSMHYARIHDHAYPVAHDHDAHPHDPAQDHRHHASANGHPTPPQAPASVGGGEEPIGPGAVSPTAAPAPDSNSASTDVQPLPTFAMPNVRTAGSGHGVGAGAPNRADGSDGAASAASGPSSNAIYPESAVTTRARLRTGARVAYPANARIEGMETDVALIIVVGADGRVLEATAAQHAGYGFDSAAIAAMKQYTFYPAQRAGQAVTVQMRWVIRFRLEE